MAGSGKACRAVGGANNKNPLPVFIPCHRVIGADGSLVGYGGGLKIKQFLLELEKKMPLIVLFLLLLAAVFLLDNRIIFRILFVVVNLWLTVMYFVIAEIQTAKLPQVPWFDPAGVSGTVVVYLALLMTAAGVLLFFLSRLLFVSRLPAVFPFIGAALLGIGLLPPAANPPLMPPAALP